MTTLAYFPSPPQGVWYLGPVPVRAYALFIIIGIIAALILGDRRWADRGGERGVVYDIALWAVPFGLIGGRIYHVITDWPTYFGDGGAGLAAAFRIWDGGLGIWGAVALGGVGAWIACRRRKIPLPAFGDAVAPGIILAQAIGRIGNYFNQELYGRATTLPWGMEIFERRDAYGVRDVHLLDGVSTGQVVAVVHPTFLYELLWNLVVFALLIAVDRRFKLGHGRLFALYVAGYCVGRFFVELLRDDTATLIAGIRVNSFTSTFVFIAAVVYIMVAPKGRDDPATLQGTGRAAAEDEHESVVDDVSKGLAATVATTGVVAAAKVAGDAEDEDAALAAEEDAEADEEAETAAVEPDVPVESEDAAPEVDEPVAFDGTDEPIVESSDEPAAAAESGAEAADADELVVEQEDVAPEVDEPVAFDGTDEPIAEPSDEPEAAVESEDATEDEVDASDGPEVDEPATDRPPGPGDAKRRWRFRRGRDQS